VSVYIISALLHFSCMLKLGYFYSHYQLTFSILFYVKSCVSGATSVTKQTGN